jgi:putative ABC transport system substrate-binding protein
MQRREFITLLGGAAAAWPLAGRAQQPAMPVIGWLNPGADEPLAFLIDPLRRGLAETGYVEGRNVAIDYRWANGQYDRLPALAADLIRRRVAVIVAAGSSEPGLVAKAATSTIPIVFQTGGDPVADGLVASMSRPEGNVTGVSRMALALEPKRLELLHEAVPKAATIAYLMNATRPRFEFQARHMQEAALALGVRLQVVQAASEPDLDGAFAAMVQAGAGALVVAQEPTYAPLWEKIAAMALRHSIPMIAGTRAFAAAGGLMSYDSSVADSFHQVGVYAGRILKGAKPSDLPVLQPTRFEFIINLKAAKALGLDIPLKLHAFASEVIE